MSSGHRTVTGAVIGTGADIEVRRVGFRPRRVALLNTTGAVTAEWQDSMPDASAVKRITAGDATYLTSKGITPLSDGFKIGDDTDINVAGGTPETIHWTAWE